VLSDCVEVVEQRALVLLRDDEGGHVEALDGVEDWFIVFVVQVGVLLLEALQAENQDGRGTEDFNFLFGLHVTIALGAKPRVLVAQVGRHPEELQAILDGLGASIAF